MLTIYVKAGGDLNKAKRHYTLLGYTCKRAITQCGCDGKNHRETMLFVKNEVTEIAVIRCITCTREEATNGNV